MTDEFIWENHRDIPTFLFKKKRFKLLSAIWWPFCLHLVVLIIDRQEHSLRSYLPNLYPWYYASSGAPVGCPQPPAKNGEYHQMVVANSLEDIQILLVLTRLD